jgi:hypothetical protein
MDIHQLTPLQASALREALGAPTHALVRNAKHYSAPHTQAHASGVQQIPSFTYRLMAMLERAWLIEFDDPQFPTRAMLTRKGHELAEQLVAADRATAGAA